MISYRLPCALIVTLLLNSSLVLAQDDDGLDIEAQPLNAALRDFAEQTGFQLMYAAEIGEGVESRGTSDSESPAEALDNLLADTGLRYQFINDRTIAIQAVEIEVAKEPGNSQPTPVLMAQNQTSVSQQSTSQESDDEVNEEYPEPMDVIVVTGSNIRGIDEGASPVIVLDRDAIDLTGLSTVEDLIKTVPQNFAGGANESVFGTTRSSPNFTSGSGINLRGLGNSSTLVLLNGRRLSTSDGGRFVDISLIPVSAVDRIEVLTDGASAIYGSDAVAGVVNIITKAPTDGAQTLVRVGNVTSGDKAEYQIGQTFGREWGSGGFIGGVEYRSQDRLSAADRDFVELPEDNDIFSDNERLNAFLNLTQEITPSILANFDAIISEREYSQRQNTNSNPTVVSGTTQTVSAGVGLTVALSDAWELRLDGTYSDYDVDIFQEFPDGAFPNTESSGKSSIRGIGAIADGTLFRLPGGPVRAAVGGDYREEKQGEDPLERDVSAMFGEVSIPVVGPDNQNVIAKELTFTGSIRYEDYSDFGSTTNYKVGLVWSPVNDVKIRSTFGTSFRGPFLGQLLDRPLESTVFLFDLPDPFAPSGTTLSLIRFDIRNPELQPEEAETFSVGFEYAPSFLPDVKFKLNYFDVSYVDRITDLSFQAFSVLPNPNVFGPLIDRPPEIEFVNQLTGLPRFLNLTGAPFLPEDVEAIVDVRVRNVGITNVDGVDFEALYSPPISNGTLTIAVSGSYMLSFDRKLTPTASVDETINTLFNPVDLRIRSSATWSSEGVTLSGFLNYVDSYKNTINNPVFDVSSWTTVDVRAAYNVDNERDGLLGGVTVSLSVQNLFDRDPPDIGDPFGSGAVSGFGFDPENASALGRFVAIQFAKEW